MYTVSESYYFVINSTKMVKKVRLNLQRKVTNGIISHKTFCISVTKAFIVINPTYFETCSYCRFLTIGVIYNTILGFSIGLSYASRVIYYEL